jgi:hypothetical protein
VEDLEVGTGLKKLSEHRVSLDADDLGGGEPKASLQEQGALTEVRTDIEDGSDRTARMVME